MICGVDESGRGPVVGPLVIAGVTFENDLELIENNVRDSKKITPKRREILSKRIKESAVNYEIELESSSIGYIGKSQKASSIELLLSPYDKSLLLFWKVNKPWINTQYVIFR